MNKINKLRQTGFALLGALGSISLIVCCLSLLVVLFQGTQWSYYRALDFILVILVIGISLLTFTGISFLAFKKANARKAIITGLLAGLLIIFAIFSYVVKPDDIQEYIGCNPHTGETFRYFQR